MAFEKGLLDEIRGRAASSRDEVCGLLLGGPDRITAVLHCRNVAASPATRFEIDPGQLIAALKAARAGGPAVVGCYHSHPMGSAEPSARDAADAAPNGWLWVVVGHSEVRVFRANDGGAIFGRFTELPVLCP